MAALIIFIMKRNNGNAGSCQDIMFPVVPVFLLLFFDKSKSGVIISKIIEIIRLWTVYFLIFRQKKSSGSEMSCEGSPASERETMLQVSFHWRFSAKLVKHFVAICSTLRTGIDDRFDDPKTVRASEAGFKNHMEQFHLQHLIVCYDISP